MAAPDERGGLLVGRAGPEVVRAAVRSGDEVLALPLVGRWFLAELPRVPDEFLAYDGRGRVLERHPFLRPPTVMKPRRDMEQVTRARPVASLDTPRGERITLFAAHARDGDYCQIIRSDRRPSNRTCDVHPPRPREIRVEGFNFGGAPGGVVLFVGPVGRDIAMLEMRYADGDHADIPLHEGWALYRVDETHYERGHLPIELVARDAHGHVIGTRDPLDR